MHRTAILLGLLFLVGCSSKEPDHGAGVFDLQIIQIEHAKNFTLQSVDGYTVLTLKDPWSKGEIYHTYFLGAREQLDALTVQPGTTKVVTPLERLVVSGSPYIGYLDRLGLADKIVGVDRHDLVYSEIVRHRIENGEVAHFGEVGQLNIEVMAATTPDLFITSGYPESPEKLKKVTDLGIPILFGLEWHETDPLARLEWLKVFGAFTNQFQDAVKIYEDEKKLYETNRVPVLSNPRMNVMTGSVWDGVWYTPGGNSYMAKLMRDAEMQYAFYSNEETGSFAASMEVIVEAQSEADVWINPGDVKSLAEMKENETRYTAFKAFRNGMVYNYDAKRVGNANAFWEQAVVYPSVLLRDLELIGRGNAHDSMLYFYRKLPAQ